MSKYNIQFFLRSVYPISQKYGENPDDYPMFQIPGHEGIDYATPDGTEVISPFDGIILRDTSNDKDYGNFLVVWDPLQHCALWFCHLQDTPVNSGDKVVKGQLLAHTNNTGHSTGPHLHVNFVETDPQGNRLNQDNGKQGFLDLLDESLVNIDSAEVAQPQDPTPLVLNGQTILPIKNKNGEDMELQAVRSELYDLRAKNTPIAPTGTTSPVLSTSIIYTNPIFTNPVVTFIYENFLKPFKK